MAEEVGALMYASLSSFHPVGNHVVKVKSSCPEVHYDVGARSTIEVADRSAETVPTGEVPMKEETAAPAAAADAAYDRY